MTRLSPLAAVCGGFAAGLVGCLAQDVFFALTRRLSPSATTDAFHPPEPQQLDEAPTQTIARRVVEGLVQRGPVVRKERAGRVVHYAFGTTWGGAYGVMAGSLPSLSTLKGGVAFGLLVWAVSDDVLLPWFKVAAWPHHYPVKNHLYAIAAHAVFGAAVSASFVGLTRHAAPAAALLGSIYLTRRVPRVLRAPMRNLARGGLNLLFPIRRVARALNGMPRQAFI
jgi:uncharacterized membrane protein YagU involved in acid resistance